MSAVPASRQRLVILGTSLFASEVADLALDTGVFEVAAFIENYDREKTIHPLLDRPVIWIDDVAAMVSTHHAVCSLGTTRRRGFIAQAAAAGFSFATIVHPAARVSRQSAVGEGSIVSAGAIVAAQTTIGRHVIINRGALIGHNTVVGDYVTICPGTNIAGAVTIGEGTYIGIGAIVVDRVRIGCHAFVGAGSVVTRDVPDRAQVAGAPARIVKTDVDGR